MTDLRQRYLRPCDPARLRKLRRAARAFTSVTDFWAAHATELSQGERWFVLAPHEADGAPVLNLRDTRFRPVGRLPGNRNIACLALAAEANMIAAERHAHALAASISDAKRVVVWQHTGWGAVPGGDASILPSFYDFSTGDPGIPLHNGVLHRVLSINAGARPFPRAVEHFVALWRTGVGLQSITDDVIVLTLNDQPVVVEDPRRAANQEYRVCAAVRSLNPSFVRAALRDGISTDSQALHELARRAHAVDPAPWKAVAALLLTAGVNPVGTDASGRLPLTVLSNNRQATTAGIEVGLPLEGRCPKGQTALLQAAAVQSLSAVQTLLAMGADVHAADRFGWTAVHHAAHRGVGNVLTALLEAGADSEAPTDAGLLPVHVAQPTVTDWFPPAPGPPEPRSFEPMNLSSELIDQLRTHEDEAWHVCADLLTDQGDLRGEAIALSLAGHPASASRLLELHPEAREGRLLAVHNGLASVLQARRSGVVFRHGLVWEVAVDATHGDWAPALRALLTHPEGRTLNRLRALGDDAAALLHDLDAPHLIDLQVRLRVGTAPSPRTLPKLDRLALAAPRIEGLVLDLPNLRELELRMPFTRGASPPQVLHSLNAPGLHRVTLVTPVAVEKLPSLALLPASVRYLALQPVSVGLLRWLVEQPVVARLDVLRLDSLFVDAVELLLANPKSFAHLDLHLTVLNLAKARRHELEGALRDVGLSVVLRGINYRAEGGY